MDSPAFPCCSQAAGSRNAAAEVLGSAPREQHGQGLTSLPLHTSPSPGSQTI